MRLIPEGLGVGVNQGLKIVAAGREVRMRENIKGEEIPIRPESVQRNKISQFFNQLKVSSTVKNNEKY